VARNNFVVTDIGKAANRTKLGLNVLLVLENVGFSGQHHITRLVVGANIDNSKSGTLPEESTHFPENAVAAKERDFVETIPIC